MYFLNLVLNAISSVTTLTQVADDVGPSPAALPAGTGSPTGAAQIGYPYTQGPLPAVFNPNFYFSNMDLIRNPNINFGGIEIWYHAQLANYFLNYHNIDNAFTYFREIPMGIGNGLNVDFVLRKASGGVLYEGYYEIKVQLGSRSNWPGYLDDMNKTFRYVQLGMSGGPAYLPPTGGLPVQREYFALRYIYNPNFYVAPAPGAPAAGPALGYKFQNMHVLKRLLNNTPTDFTSALRGPYIGIGLGQYYLGAVAGVPFPPPPFQAITAYPAIPGGIQPIVNCPKSTGVVHFFQPFITPAAPPLNRVYTFQEVALPGAPLPAMAPPNIINPNIPLLCVYNGN